jgi:hypothetical protein
VALFQLESSSNEETVFERIKFRELGCGCSHFGCARAQMMHANGVDVLSMYMYYTQYDCIKITHINPFFFFCG